MKILLIAMLLFAVAINGYAITEAECKTAMLNGDTVYFYSPDAKAYVSWKRAELPDAEFKEATISSGTILVLTTETRVVDAELVETKTANIGGKAVSLDDLYLTKSAFRTALKAALQARIDAVLVIVATDEDHIVSVDEIGDPVLVVSETVLDFGDTTTSMDLDITNSGDGKLIWKLSSDAIGITLSDGSGDTKKEVDTITVSVDRAVMSAGTHSFEIVVTSDGGEAEVELTVLVP